jgi:hypothetical protein
MYWILNEHIRSLEEKNMSIDIIDGLLKQWYKVWMGDIKQAMSQHLCKLKKSVLPKEDLVFLSN